MARFKFANNPQTTLSGAIGAGDTTLSVASAADFPASGTFPIVIDSEILWVTGVAGTLWTVERGKEGTSAAAHNNNAVVTGVLTKSSLLSGSMLDVRSFGAEGDGTTDDTAAIQAAIDAASTVVLAGTSNNDQVTAAVRLPAGRYRITAPIELANCVQLIGDGSGATWIDVDGAIDGIVTPGTAGVDQFSNIWVTGMTLRNASGTALSGFNVFGLIRNCGFRDVVCQSFVDSWVITESWTLTLENCAGYNATGRHIEMGTGCGIINIIGGRYDVADDDIIYMNASTGELIMRGVIAQFGKKASVRVDSARSVILEGCFFEGSCIGSSEDYYVYLNGNNDSLSSAVVVDCVMNDLADDNRKGLGALYVNNFESLMYRERWVRNATASLPILGANVQSIDLAVGNAGSLTNSLTPISWNEDNFARVRQLNRPHQFFGIDMNGGPSVSPNIRSTATFRASMGTSGVAVGTYDQEPALQGFNSGGGTDVLRLNPHGGDVEFGNGTSAVARVPSGSNRFLGVMQGQALLTGSNATPGAHIGYVGVDCTAGNRACDLGDYHAPGRMMVIGKRDGTANTLRIDANFGNINGAASFTLTAPYQHVTVISDGTNWFVVQ